MVINIKKFFYFFNVGKTKKAKKVQR